MTRIADFLQLLRSVILAISKGFVDFNTGGLPIGWCGRQSWVGAKRMLGWVVGRVCTEADQATSSSSDHVPIDWEKEDYVLDLAKWDLHTNEDGIHDGRGGQGL